MLSLGKLNLTTILIVFSSFGFQSLTAQYPGKYTETPEISKIILNGDSVVDLTDQRHTGSMAEKEIILGPDDYSIAFEAEPGNKYEFRFLLSGFDKGKGTWRESGYKEYTNLAAGKYVLHLWCRNSEHAETECTPLAFSIRPFWYLSGLAIIFYIITIALSVWALYSFFFLRFARRQYILEQIINKRTEDLILEKEKTEALLANVLPKNTADEIMAKGKAEKVKYNFVTVLFSDIQGFTQIAEEMNPEALIDELDKFFFHFDSVVGKYKIEKIKTIGDAYMCAGGIPEKNRTNPVEVILAALEMQQYMSELKEASILQGMKYWDIRIGIHTGTVVAGVVGHKKLSYDIWGDTVNTASRMESSGQAGKINISGTTYEFVKDFFVCEYRGKMPVKYKGELDMYFVKEILPELRDGNSMPNDRFLFKMQLIRLQDVEETVSKMFADEAPPNLYFNNAAMAHSISSHVDLLANAESISDEEYLSLKLASVFIITGYMSDYEKPAEAALNLIDEILPGYGFNADQIKEAGNLILNSFAGNCISKADMILHDARYDYLGRADYIKQTDRLLRERNEHGIAANINDWIESQKVFLREHEFLTETARILKSVSVEDQIAALAGNN